MVERLSRRVACLGASNRHRNLKGAQSEVALFEVLWQTEDITSMVPHRH